jgi:S-methylmethionine-dependent homocysteine/selenocysteine methylase
MTRIYDTGRYVTDGGLETDLIFNRGIDLPEFASFPLLGTAGGRSVLTDYYDGYADVARRAGAGLVLETPTWRANPDWATGLGYDASALDAVNRSAVDLLHRVRDSHTDLHDAGVVVSGNVGPRGDGYVAETAGSADDYAEYHSPQIAAFKAVGADVTTAMTMTSVAEALGVATAARAVGLPAVIMFTVETDGRLPDGTPLAEAVATVDEAGAPDWFGVNCAHPEHVEPGLTDGGWRERLVVVRPNASRLSHAELDEAEELDEGDPVELRGDVETLRDRLPSLRILGGCCGTDVRHVASLWGV